MFLVVLIAQCFYLNAFFLDYMLTTDTRTTFDRTSLGHWCLPIFGKFITISKLSKVLVNKSSGDFYSSLLKGHHGMLWYVGQ